MAYVDDSDFCASGDKVNVNERDNKILHYNA